MDPLTQTVHLLHPQAFAWKEATAAGDWALRFPSTKGVSFCLIAAGSCRLDVPGHETRRLGEGDYVLLAAPPEWTLSDGAPTDIIDSQSHGKDPDRRGSFVGQPGSTAATRLVGGHFRFDEANGALLTGLMPTLVEIHSSEPGAARLRGVLGLIDDEASSDRPGRTLIIERLLEIMLVEAIRHGSGPAGTMCPGLLAGLRDRTLAAALRAIHADIRRRWTVADLASAAGTSRSVFAERFTRIVGLPPIDYLLHWRMALAKDALRRGTGRLSEIAFACGYQSASAFSTAFSRTVGCAPAKYAAGRDAEQSPDQDQSGIHFPNRL